MNLVGDFLLFVLLVLAAGASAKDCATKKSSHKLICYYGKVTDVDSCKCSHIVLPSDADLKTIEGLREKIEGVKVLITVNEFNQGLVDILKSSKVDGIEIDLKKLDSKNDIADFIATVRSKLGTNLNIVLSVPAKADLLAKFYDFKTLSKHADLFVLQTAFLGASKNVTFHPSRLSGLWDMQNTDSVVDLVTGLGAPLSKLVITAPVQAFRFRLQSEEHTAPGSPALEVQSINRDELCQLMKNGKWTLERDQDQAGPYIFSKDQWIAFDDSTSVDIKAKYSRVRGLAGLALKDLSQDGGLKCDDITILESAYNGLSRQARAPRGAVLHSLEREILDSSARPLDTVQVSPYRISRVIDVEGHVHVVRQDTRTEFECSRQGYFVHPRSCGRFYRCVKFDQLSDEFSVFEFDCPAGLAFDERVEVCVWPGSLPHASACAGSSEIAPVPKQRFVCPSDPGYYADPENCRWFFACLDHGKSPLSAYEFRCPFGLVYDESRLLCEWPWLVPRCASGLAVGSEVVYGGSGLVALDQYKGLGTLGATQLGGLQGPLIKSVAKVYSNVGHSNSLQYQSGLSTKAIDSLQKSGLLLVKSQGGGSQYDVGGGSTTSLGNEGNYAQFAHNSANDQLAIAINSGNGQYAAGNAGGQYNQGVVNSVLANHGATLVAGNTGLYNQGGQYAQVQYAANNAGEYNQAAYNSANEGAGNSAGGYDQGVYNSANEGAGNYDQGQGVYVQSGEGAKSHQSFTQYHQQQQQQGYVAAHQYNLDQNYNGKSQDVVVNTNAHLVNGLAYDNAAKSQQTFTQYQGQGKQISAYDTGAINAAVHQYQANTGIAGNINIVGGGHSAVGVLDGIEVSNNGENSNTISQVTALPSVPVQIPTVTSVPVPALKVAAGFESYKGGVIANVPELQYSVQKGGSSSTLFEGANLNLNAAKSYVNIVSSTPATVVQQTGYDYPTGVKQVDVTLQKTEGYVYPKPTVAFEEVPTKSVLVEQRPQVYISTTTPSPVSYNYPKPSLVLEERPRVEVTSYNVPSTTVKQPQIYASTTPAPTFLQTVQPVVQSYATTSNLDKQTFQGYTYDKPAIRFEEKPAVVTSYAPVVVQQQQQQQYGYSGTYQHQQQYQYQQPAVTYQVQQPAVTYQVQQPQSKVTTYKDVLLSGYSYPKPAIKFEETPASVTRYSYVAPVKQQQPVVTYSTPKPAISTYSYTPVQPQVVVEQQQPQILVEQQQPLVTYTTPRPAVVSTYSYTAPVKQQVAVEPVVTYSTPRPVVKVQSQGYDYPKPSVAFVEGPSYEDRQVVEQKAYIAGGQSSSYFNQQTSNAQQVVVEQQQPVVTYTTPAPAVISSYSYTAPVKQQQVIVEQQQPVVTYTTPRPAVISGYSYTPVQQKVIVEQQQPVVTYTTPRPAVVSSYSYTAPVKQVAVEPVITYTTPKPAIVESYSYTPVKQQVIVEQPVEYTTPRPSVVSSYSYTAPVKQQVVTYSTPRPVVKVQSQGYDYPKPSVAFVEGPAYENRQTVEQKAYVAAGQSSSYFNQQTHQAEDKLQFVKQQVVVEQPQPVVTYTTPRPVAISSYSYIAPVQQKVIVEQQQPVVTYTTPRPAAISSYSYTAPVQQEVIVEQQQPVVTYTTPRPAVVSSYSYTAPVKQQVAVEPVVTYTTPKPALVESYSYTPVKQQVIVEQPITYSTPRPVVNVQSKGYDYPKPSVAFVEGPSYDDRQPVEEVPFVAQKAYVTGGQSNSYFNQHKAEENFQFVQQQPIVVESYQAPRNEYKKYKQQYSEVDAGYVYDKPSIRFEENPDTVVDYEQSTPKPTIQSVVNTVVASKYEQQPFYSYDSRLTPVEPALKTTYTAKTPVVVDSGTTSRPIAKYSFSSLDEKYQQYDNPQVVVENYVAKEYLPAIEVTTRQYLPPRKRVKVTTTPEVYVVPEVTTRQYLPPVSRKRVKVTTTERYEVPEVSREYLPSVTTPSAVSRRPAKVLKAVRPAKTIVKVNDFHPLLSAKLGAQCTCVSNTVQLRRKKPLRIVVEDDNEDDDGYVVGDNSGVIVENYQYEPKKIVVDEDSLTPIRDEVEVTQAPIYTVRKRVRVRPVTTTYAPVTDVTEVFLKNLPAVTIVKSSRYDDEPSDREIAKAVRTGLKLVKQAAKEGAKEGAEEVLTKDFDRYGPGGLRSRNERLQGTIDCQRAGLFRHPTQCNKFYSCRWDCKKNKFTLHVFNCPVHLTFDNSLGACNWPSQGPACLENTLLPSD